MRNRQFVIASMISLSLLSGLGGITSFAKGPGETTSTATTQINIATYTKSVIAGLGNWEKQSDNNNTWKFRLNTGGYLNNSWIESLNEPNAFYYVNKDGVMLVNSITPDGYTVDINGLYRKSTNGINPNENSSKSTQNTPGNTTSPSQSSGKRTVMSGGVPVEVNERGYDANGKYVISDEVLQGMQDHYLGTGNYGSID